MLIEEKEVMDPSKAMGLDCIDGEILRMASPGIRRSLTSLYNFSLMSHQFASEWKYAIVTPIPKGKLSQDVNSFCPVSVLSIVFKVLEWLVYSQLSVYIQEHSILHEAQSRFRPHHNTQDVLVSTGDDWGQAL